MRTQPVTAHSGTARVLSVLFLGAFAMGSAELLVVGVLDLVAADLEVSVPAAGALGVFSMGLGPSLQYRVVTLAGPGGQLAQSLPASAINLGIAFGAFAGGAALATFGTSAAVLTGVAIAALAEIVVPRPAEQVFDDP